MNNNFLYFLESTKMLNVSQSNFQKEISFCFNVCIGSITRMSDYTSLYGYVTEGGYGNKRGIYRVKELPLIILPNYKFVVNSKNITMICSLCEETKYDTFYSHINSNSKQKYYTEFCASCRNVFAKGEKNVMYFEKEKICDMFTLGDKNIICYGENRILYIFRDRKIKDYTPIVIKILCNYLSFDVGKIIAIMIYKVMCQ